MKIRKDKFFKNLLILVLLIYLLIFKRHKEFFKIITGIISTWLIFYIFLPSDEFKEFLNQYIIVINVSDYLLGLEFPKPFSEESTRYTKALLLMVISGVFIINFIFNKSDNETHNIKFFLLFIFISYPCILIYSPVPNYRG